MVIDMTVGGAMVAITHGEKLQRTSRRHPNYMKIVCMDSPTHDIQSDVKFMIVILCLLV